MITTTRLSILAFSFFLLLPCYAQDQSEGEISGTIKSLDNTLPWQMVLALAPIDGITHSRLTEVKSDGSFRFARVGKSTYRIQVSKGAGYVWKIGRAHV
jgi:hypothetical protein